MKGIISFLIISLLLISTIVFAANPVGQVVWIKGTVRASSQQAPLQRRDIVYEHDTITTSSGSSGELIFTDGSTMSLSANTQIQIDQYRYTAGKPSSTDRYVVNLAKGGFRTITGAISKSNPAGYQVNTPVATIGVRGTEYTAYYVPCQGAAATSGIKATCGLATEILFGSIAVSNPSGAVNLTAGTANRYAFIGSVNVAPKVTSAPVIKTVVPPITQPTTSPTTPSDGTTTTLCI